MKLQSSCPTTLLQDASTKGFLANEQAGKHYPNCGADDDQADAIVHAMTVVALLAGQPEMLPTIANIIRVTQNTDQAVAFGLGAARILEAVGVGWGLGGGVIMGDEGCEGSPPLTPGHVFY